MTEFHDKEESRFFEKYPVLEPKRTQTIGVRPYPRFLQVEHYEEGDSFRINIPTARRTWWAIGLGVAATIWSIMLPIIFTISLSGLAILPSFLGVIPMVVIIVLLVMALGWVTLRLLRWFFPRIRITADHSGIHVHDRFYRWEDAGGFRIGYSIGGEEREEKQFFFHGLRMAYGNWGDDLPFLVYYFYAPAYIMFLNYALEGVQPRSIADQSADSGIKPVLF